MTDQALQALGQALKLAAPEGYVRRFVEAGAPMAGLLRLAQVHRLFPDYTRQLLAACAAQAVGRTAGACWLTLASGIRDVKTPDPA